MKAKIITNKIKIGFFITLTILFTLTTVHLAGVDKGQNLYQVSNYGGTGNSLALSYPADFNSSESPELHQSNKKIVDSNWVEYDAYNSVYQPYYSYQTINTVSYWYQNTKTSQRVEFWKSHSIPDNFRSLILEAIEQNQTSFLKGKVYRITSANINENWATFSVVVVDDTAIFDGGASRYILNGGIIAVLSDKNWVAALECDLNFEKVLELTPEKFINKETKKNLTSKCGEITNKLP